jgi:hypothetical protein
MLSIDTTNLSPFINTATKKNNGDTYIVRTLDPGFISNFDISNRIYRSMISDENGNVISIAPAKSLPNDNFLDASSTFSKFSGKIISNCIKAEEIIEGTMINLFYNKKWEIATKKSVGGNYHFFRNQYLKDNQDIPELEQKTFLQMFLDGLGTEKTLNEYVNENSGFDKSHCYSFVLQHPSNHIVVPADKPAVFLVHMCQILEKVFYKYVEPNPDVFKNTAIKFPRRFLMESAMQNKTIENAFEANLCIFDQSENFQNVFNYAKKITENPLNSHVIPGIMMTNLETGFRTSFVNAKYTEIKILRGNNPNLHYQYLVLRKTNKVADFLHYFPQYAAHFDVFSLHFMTFATRIHQLYLNVHVLKINTLADLVDKSDKYHVEKLHYERYLPMLKAAKAALNSAANIAHNSEFKSTEIPKPKITRKLVIEYLDSENVMVPLGL